MLSARPGHRAVVRALTLASPCLEGGQGEPGPQWPQQSLFADFCD